MHDCILDLGLVSIHIWQAFLRYYLMLQNWVFVQFTHLHSRSKMEISILFLRYWGLCYNRDICNTFLFNGRFGVDAKIQEKDTERITTRVSLLYSRQLIRTLNRQLCSPASFENRPQIHRE